jgi:hypothetical protein
LAKNDLTHWADRFLEALGRPETRLHAVAGG